MIIHPFKPAPEDVPRRFRKTYGDAGASPRQPYSPDATQFRAMGWSLRGPKAFRWADAALALFVMGFLAAVVATPFLAMLALLKWLFW